MKNEKLKPGDQLQFICPVIAGDTIKLTITKNGYLYFKKNEIEINFKSENKND